MFVGHLHPPKQPDSLFPVPGAPSMTIWSLSAYSLMAYEVRKFLQVQTLFFRYPTSERVDMVRLWMQEFRSLESREANPLISIAFTPCRKSVQSIAHKD
ncbi:MAG: hypothetical protein GX836_00590 [Spirochaetales bacterium]|nr:hypothetical protein [Spirochaetales bacterium]